MPRITNRNTLATKALAISDASSDALIALEDAVAKAQKALAQYLHEHEDERRRRDALRDTAPPMVSNRGFSIWAAEPEYSINLTRKGQAYLDRLREQEAKEAKEAKEAAAKAEHGGDAA
jgi:hypothetical protein